MALFDEGSPQTLEDVLGQQADTASMGIENAYGKARKRLVGQQAHAGRLGSGVANYPLGDLNASEASALGGVQGNLASALGQIPASDYLYQQGNQQNNSLAELIASLNRPSDLEQALGVLGMAGKLGGTVAAFA